MGPKNPLLGYSLSSVQIHISSGILRSSHGEQKPVKDRYTELDQKLEQLRKKKNKELGKIQDGKLTRAPSKPKNPLNKRSLNKIAKIFSKANLESTTSPSASPADDPEAKCENVKRLNAEKEINCERNYLQLETELREKYYESIFSCADKLLSKNQSSQLKTLEILHNNPSVHYMFPHPFPLLVCWQ